MVDTSLRGGADHALERCYRERRTPEVLSGVQARVLLRLGPSRPLLRLPPDCRQVDPASQAFRRHRFPRALPPPLQLPLPDRPRHRSGAGHPAQGPPFLGRPQTARLDPSPRRLPPPAIALHRLPDPPPRRPRPPQAPPPPHDDFVGLEEIDDGVYDCTSASTRSVDTSCRRTGSRILSRGYQSAGARSTWPEECQRRPDTDVIPMS